MPLMQVLHVHERPLADGVAAEQAWVEQAARSGERSGHVWREAESLVAPRSYQRLPGWQQACAQQHAVGVPVRVRASGGGLVPQGPGLLDLSLVWCADGQQADSDAIYRALCQRLVRALARLGLPARASAVQGAFCDGRFNLAIGARKCIGTAQAWRRLHGRQVVLAHALLVVQADEQALCRRLNAFEHAAGSPRRYLPEAITSLARAWRELRGQAPPADLEVQVADALRREFARA